MKPNDFLWFLWNALPLLGDRIHSWGDSLPAHMLVFGAIEMFTGGVLAAFFRYFFCVKLHDRGMTVWLYGAIALLGARLIGARLLDLPLDMLAGSIYVSMGTAILVIGIRKAASSSVFRQGGRRCPLKPSDQTQRVLSSSR